MFYETLLQQNPNSEMAQDWCLMYGILEVDAATSLYKKVCKRKGKPITPIKTEVTSSSTSKKNDNDKVVPKSTKVTVPTGNKKAKIIDDVAVDTGLEASGAWESRGAIGV